MARTHVADHHIDMEIPESGRKLVRGFYYSYLVRAGPTNQDGLSPLLICVRLCQLRALADRIRDHPALSQVFIASLFWNWAALCANLHFVGAIAIGQWMLAVIFLLAGVPGAWFLWYEKIYTAVKDDTSLTYLKFFGGHAVHIGFLIVACISFPIGSNSYALAGIWPGIQFMHDGAMR